MTRTSDDERCEIVLARDYAIQLTCIDLIQPPPHLNKNNIKGVVDGQSAKQFGAQSLRSLQ